MDAWRRRSSLAALAPVGWSLVIISGVPSGSAGTPPRMPTPGFASAGIHPASSLGFVTIVLFSAAARRAASFGARFAGLMSLTRLTSAFGDILSYLRLFALGLASASLAIAFNDLANDVHENIPGLGFFVAIIIIVIGHTINFVLCIVSGFVHGLRLNLIEFFNWSIPEEGLPFRAFRKKKQSLE